MKTEQYKIIWLRITKKNQSNYNIKKKKLFQAYMKPYVEDFSGSTELIYKIKLLNHKLIT